MSFRGFILKCTSDQLLLIVAGQYSSGQGNISQLVRETGISENQDTRCTCQSGNTGVNDCVQMCLSFSVCRMCVVEVDVYV